MKPDSSAPRSLRGLRLAFVSRQHPYVGLSGANTYIATVLQALVDAGARVRVIVVDSPDEAGASRLWRDPSPPAIETRIRHRSPLLRWHFRPWHFRLPGKNRLRRLLGLSHATPVATGPVAWPAWDRVVDRSEAAYIWDEIGAFRPDAIIVNYSWLAEIWRDPPPQFSSVARFLLAHDVRHLECALVEQRIVYQERMCYPRARENAELALVDVIVAIQKREEAFFRNMRPDKKVITVGLPLHHRDRSREPRARHCLLVGSNNDVNAAGALWFLDACWTAVRRSVPDATLHICGSLCEHPRLKDAPPFPGVTLRGRVENLTAEYEDAAVVVAPVLAGSGLKIKVAEAIAHGCALVGTSISLDGVDPLPATLPPCDSPDAFGARVAQLLFSPAERLRTEQAVRTLALTSFSPEACLAPLIDQLAAAFQRSRVPAP